MASERVHLDVDDLVESYEGGESLKSLAHRLGVSRPALTRRLKARGVAIRGGSEANRISMSAMTSEQRNARASAAHAARRGSTDRPGSVRLRATRRAERNALLDWQVGTGEGQLGAWLEARGQCPIPQLAVGPYNVDLALPPVAVEVSFATNMPLLVPRLRKRAEHLVDQGWRVCYVWVTRNAILTEGAADQVIAYVDLAQRHPASVGHYRVIRGTGEVVTLS